MGEVTNAMLELKIANAKMGLAGDQVNRDNSAATETVFESPSTHPIPDGMVKAKVIYDTVIKGETGDKLQHGSPDDWVAKLASVVFVEKSWAPLKRSRLSQLSPSGSTPLKTSWTSSTVRRRRCATRTVRMPAKRLSCFASETAALRSSGCYRLIL